MVSHTVHNSHSLQVTLSYMQMRSIRLEGLPRVLGKCENRTPSQLGPGHSLGTNQKDEDLVTKLEMPPGVTQTTHIHASPELSGTPD